MSEAATTGRGKYRSERFSYSVGCLRAKANAFHFRGVVEPGVIDGYMPKPPNGRKISTARGARRKTARVHESEQLYLIERPLNGASITPGGDEYHAPRKNGVDASVEPLLPAGDLEATFFGSRVPAKLPPNFLYQGSCENLLWEAKRQNKKFDLIFTSPPYNLGKPYTGYADDRDLSDYIEWQETIIGQCVDCLADTGSLCWQVGNYVSNGLVVPLDMELYPIFKRLGLKLRNRIVWHFGHGLHCNRRFSGRYEVVLWYTKSDDYRFNLDAVRIPSKYPNKKHFKGPKKGQLSGNPLGKNPADIWSNTDGIVWDIPNVKHNHTEKTEHPCQFPIGLVMRFIKALTHEGDTVFDPFLGVGTTAAAAVLLKRRFFGSELNKGYFNRARKRIELATNGLLPFRDPNKPVYEPPTPRTKNT